MLESMDSADENEPCSVGPTAIPLSKREPSRYIRCTSSYKSMVGIKSTINIDSVLLATLDYPSSKFIFRLCQVIIQI